MTARRKQEAVLRVLRGEPLEMVAREIGATVADLSGWRDRFLDGGTASLKSRRRDDRDDRIMQLKAKLGEITMDNELLYEKIARMEAGSPLGRRRSRKRAQCTRSPGGRGTALCACAGSGMSAGLPFIEHGHGMIRRLARAVGQVRQVRCQIRTWSRAFARCLSTAHSMAKGTARSGRGYAMSGCAPRRSACGC
ncbi:helix-turn-helix domain-containing protein [Nioella sp.]|uniref:helix-turn-helix domain-containing protein n=1 Tax=Nioella sp. TaxID=1912091 RepID=UPI003A882353